MEGNLAILGLATGTDARQRTQGSSRLFLDALGTKRHTPGGSNDGSRFPSSSEAGRLGSKCQHCFLLWL